MIAPATTDAPGLSEAEAEAWEGFLRAHARVVRELDAELSAEQGLSLSAYDVLVRLGEAPGRRLRMSELADSVLLTPSGLTRLVDRLCREGLVERRRCPSDGRGAFAVLTAKGAARLEAAREAHLDGVRRLFLSRVSAADQRHLADCWRRLLPDW